MSEPDYREVKAEEERRLLHSFGYWDLVVLGALGGAGLGLIYGIAAEPRQRGISVFAGMAVGALAVFLGGWARAQLRAREHFFASWAAERGWSYAACGVPFADTPFLHSGDRRKASDFFSGIWPPQAPEAAPQAVLYQHTKIVGSGRSEQTYTFVVLHLILDRPAIDLLQIWPHGHAVVLGEKIFGHHGELGERIELESTELMQHFRVSTLRGWEERARELLTPSAIVKILDVRRALGDTKTYFEIQGTRAAFLVEEKLSPKRPQRIEQLLELWKPVADWLAEATGTERTPPIVPGGGG